MGFQHETSDDVSMQYLVFDGFLVFDVLQEGISFSLDIAHVDSSQVESSCWYSAYLNARSLVHNRVVTTMKGHTIVAYDLDKKEEHWRLNLDENNKDCAAGGFNL